MVQIKGKDSIAHSLTLEASSVFDAANRAIQSWARYWWFDPETLLIVQAGDQRWAVKQESVRKWRAKQSRPLDSKELSCHPVL